MSEGMKKRTILPDAQGKKHEYVTYLLDWNTGLPLYRQIQKTLVRVLGHGIEGVGGVRVGEGEGVLQFMNGDMKGEALVNALDPMIDLLNDSEWFLDTLFNTTSRDKTKLNTSIAKGEAYQANYGEGYAATMWLINENFLSPLAGFLSQFLGEEMVTKWTERFQAFFKDQTEVE